MSLANWWADFSQLHLSKPATDRTIFRALRTRTIETLLEIGTGHEKRLPAIDSWLQRRGGKLKRYAAIDPFESAGREPLKQVHSRCAALAIKPMLVPGPLAMGIPRIACTLGQVDMVIVNESVDQLGDAGIQNFLPRICSESTLFLVVTGSAGSLQPTDWTQFTAARRVAA